MKQGLFSYIGQEIKEIVTSKKAIVFTGFLVAGLLTGISAFSEKGLSRINSFSAELKRYETLISKVEEENRRLQREVNALRNDPEAVASVARDEFVLLLPGEKFYKFEK